MKGLGGQSRQLVLVGALAVFGLGVYYTYVLGPLFRRLKELGQTLQTTRVQLQHLELALASEPQLRQQQAQLSSQVASLRTVIPSEEELPSVIKLLSDVASHTNVKIKTIFPVRFLEPLPTSPAAPPKPEDHLYNEVPIQIDALAGFHQLGSFLSQVESGEYPMRIQSLRIMGNPKEPRRHEIKVTLSGYFATAQETPPTAGTSSGSQPQS